MLNLTSGYDSRTKTLLLGNPASAAAFKATGSSSLLHVNTRAGPSRICLANSEGVAEGEAAEKTPPAATTL